MSAIAAKLAPRLPFYYGYWMLPLAMAMQVGTSPGQTFAVSAFTPALLESLQLSESRLALAYMLGTLLAAIPLSTVGPISDRIGLRWSSLIIIAALSATCWYASMVSGFATLLVAFFLLRFLGQGSLTLLSGNTTSMWFRRRIGRVSAIISIGTSFAFAYVPGMLANAIEANGWRSTYQTLAGILAIGLLPLIAIFFCNRPEDIGQQLDGWSDADRRSDVDSVVTEERSWTLKEVCRTKSYYVIGLTSAVWAMIGTGVVFYLFTLCADRGFESSTAADLMKTFGLTMLGFQFAGSLAADHLKLNWLLGLGATMLTAGLVVLAPAQSTFAMHVYSFLFGGGQGVLIATTGVVWVRYYGREHLGSIRGAVWCATVAGSGCGPLIMGSVKDLSGTYVPAIWIFTALMLPLALAAWWIRPPVTPATETES
ncbi:MFS transporter [Rhodopirellula halodulae]|uniref:MFS transporter n=1 Tax=Rhodopirellula halodulae TaxID=2894198 RepID=UPI001E431738|nr:MFS transporter [Rhodopirellula sp. JC737]MCC9655819.1 MFS transporter [Rhodopirellula sp. JC737]